MCSTAARSGDMDVHSALANVASRKQLRRLGGALELSVDESGSLDELLSLDATTVDAAMLSVLGADGATRARSRLEQRRLRRRTLRALWCRRRRRGRKP